MNELKIDLENINPVTLWGSNNEYFEVLKKQFPKIKIVARGNEVKILGDDTEIALFTARFSKIVQHVEKFQSLSTSELERFLDTKISVEAVGEVPQNNSGSEPIVFGHNGIVVKARTANQRRMVDGINKNDILFAIGPAGTGKTYTAVALAVRALKNKEIKRIILTRPAVEAGENLGFLPGDLKEKIDPYL
ncbi:MAG: PhoH family protein, partial [Pyrinomonadaceae bacterium]|nr:PhoH family protein [Sphingobacteriaceae bacterium]